MFSRITLNRNIFVSTVGVVWQFGKKKYFIEAEERALANKIFTTNTCRGWWLNLLTKFRVHERALNNKTNQE